MECHDTIAAACHLVHARCAKILSIRARAGLLEDLISSDFLSLVHNVEDFVRRSTVITGIQCLNLRIALQSQAKAFLDHFHESSRNKLRYKLAFGTFSCDVTLLSGRGAPIYKWEGLLFIFVIVIILAIYWKENVGNRLMYLLKSKP